MFLMRVTTYAVLFLVGATTANLFQSYPDEEEVAYIYPVFGTLTMIDFDQLLRAEMARESRAAEFYRRKWWMSSQMKRSLALGRARFRPGKRAVEVPFMLETGDQPLVIVKHSS